MLALFDSNSRVIYRVFSLIWTDHILFLKRKLKRLNSFLINILSQSFQICGFYSNPILQCYLMARRLRKFFSSIPHSEFLIIINFLNIFSALIKYQTRVYSWFGRTKDLLIQRGLVDSHDKDSLTVSIEHKRVNLLHNISCFFAALLFIYEKQTLIRRPASCGMFGHGVEQYIFLCAHELVHQLSVLEELKRWKGAHS